MPRFCTFTANPAARPLVGLTTEEGRDINEIQIFRGVHRLLTPAAGRLLAKEMFSFSLGKALQNAS